MIFSSAFRSELRRRFSISAVLVAVAVGLCSGCNNRKAVRSEENPTPLPPHRFYVAKAFSVVTESGVTGFPVGKVVTRIREENGEFIIGDEGQLIRAPKSSFTTDVTTINRLRQSQSPRPGAGLPASKPQVLAPNFSRDRREGSAPQLDRERKDVAKQRRERLEGELATVKNRISAANAEIATKQGKSGYTLSIDASASGMKDLLRRRQALEAELGILR